MIFDDLCPKALTKKPFTVKQAFYNVKNKTFNRPLATMALNIWNNILPGQNGAKYRKNYYINSMKINPDKESPTLTKTCPGTGGIMHFAEKRTLSIEEIKRLGFLHDEFNMTGNFDQQWERIGNTVPPGLMRAIAINLRHYLFNSKPLMQYPKSMTYFEILDAAWQEHLTPKDVNAPTVISTFAGCGGSSLGYSMAGFRELLAVEWDNNAVDTFRLNFPHVSVYHGDICKLSVEECIKLSGLMQPGELDVLDGSPPCQGFSTAGKRQMSDTRNQLFLEYVRLLRGLQPKAFVMENVSGMIKGKMKLIFADIMRELKASGYEVKTWLLNAKYFYVPQSRERLIFIGVRKNVLQDKCRF